MKLLASLVIAIDMPMKKRHKKLPDLVFLNQLFDYDPLTGGLYKKGAEHCEANVVGSFTASGHRLVHVKGHGPFLVHRLVFYMYYRRDPKHYMVDHINCDPADNRIENLRCVRPRKNGLNRRTKRKYVVDDDGVGRWITGCP